MSKVNIKRKNWLKKKVRTKKSLGVLGKLPRLVVFKSNKHIYAQLLDDNKSKTILSSSSLDKNVLKDIKKSTSKTDVSKIVGHSIGEKIIKSKKKNILFDRNGYKYHGRVKALADAIREKGVTF